MSKNGGHTRTIESYNSFATKPEFKATDNFFTVKLPNMNYKNDPINDLINDVGLAILRIVKDNPGIKIDAIISKMKAEVQSITVDRLKIILNVFI